MKSYFIQASAECAYPGEFWKNFKPLLPSKSTQQQHIQRLEEGWLIIDNMEIGNIFNKHFIDGVAAHIPILSEHAFANRLSVHKISRRRNHLQLSFRHVEKKATGPDKISQKVLTISSEALTVPLTNLINHCITINAWPSLWKHSNVSPVYKKDSPTDKVNYRPVSVLTCFPKIFERVLHDQMLDFAKLIRSDSLSGLLKGDSCATVLLKMTDDFRASLNNKDHCTAIAEDVSKAFDSISHSLLISKLKAYGFTESTVNLIRSYLCDRLQRVKIGNTYSDWKTVQHGVPQGSILVPLLFNLFINDLTYSVDDAKLRLYADDTTLNLSHPNQDVLESRIQSKFDVLQSWFRCNYFSINESKTKVLPLGDNPPSYELFADRTGPPLEVVRDMQLLGLTIDSSLSFKAHIKYVCNKVNVKVSALRRVRKFVPSEVMVNIYKAFILLHLEYCAPVFAGLSSGLSNKLELTNQYAIRTLLKMGKSTSYSDLLTYVGLKTLVHRRFSHALSLFNKSLYNMGPNNINKIFLSRNNEYDFRGFCKLNQRAYNSRLMHRPYHYITSRLWNNLPDYVRRAPSLNIFKSMLDEVNSTTGVECNCNFCT